VRRNVYSVMLAIACAVTAWIVPVQASQAVHLDQDRIVNADPANFTPNVLDGSVESIQQVGNSILIGGDFHQIQASTGGPILTRNNLAAFDATTGAISTTFVPNPDGEVTTIIPAGDGSTVYIGGYFNNVSGAGSPSTARINATTGARITAFQPPTLDGRIKDMRLVGNRLWLAGYFTTVENQPQVALATVNATTGAFDPFMGLSIAGVHNGGVTTVMKMDVTPDGSELVAIGNFNDIEGVQHHQVFMLNLTGASAAVENWQTNFYTTGCSGAFQTYLRDLDISPDGSYFVVSTTGAYGGANVSCDSTSRWETSARGSNLSYRWIDNTGGDTTYAVAATGTAVYVGGHQRWQNNPFAGDSPGPGAVSRPGIAALDPANGLPFSWNPTRERGVGVFDLYSTSTGLWVGSDTDHIGANFEYHPRIAFFPLAGGTVVKPNNTSWLPNNIYQAGPRGPAASPSILYRVNAAGDAIGATDGGSDWAADTAGSPDPHHGAGSNTAGYSPVPNVNATVPASTPRAIFDSERWGAQTWSFPVPTGVPLQVRLYFANRYGGTSSVGQRVFDVSLEGTTVLDNYDIVADAGDQTGTMKAFDITSDGTVNLSLSNVVENPLINGIEIIRTDLTDTGAADAVTRTAYDGTTFGAHTSTPNGGISWRDNRGAFMLNGVLYAGSSDGSFTRRTYDGTTFGAATAINTADALVPMTDWHSEVSQISGMFFDAGRLYYTLAGQSNLYYRYFTPESGVVGSYRFTATGNVAGVDFSKVNGMFITTSSIYWASSVDGSLRRSDWSSATGAPTGSSTTVSTDDWRAHTLFLFQSTNGTPPNQPPTAQVGVTCDDLDCTYSSAGSTDPDGTITSYAWNFGDGGTDTGASPAHRYPAAGTYTVTLTVTDNDGGTGQATQPVTVTHVNGTPTASFTVSCGGLTCSVDASGSSDPDGPIASYAWTFGDGGTATGVTASHTYAATGTFTVGLTVNDGDGGTDSTTRSATANSDPVTFKGSDNLNANVSQFTVTVPSGVSAGDLLLLFFADNDPAPTVTGPAGWTQVQTVTSANQNGRVWRKTATAADAGSQVRVNTSAITKADTTLLAYSGISGTTPVAASAAGSETVTRTTHTTPTVASSVSGARLISYWGEKSSATTAMVPPAGMTTRASSSGSGSGRITSLTGDSGPLAPGTLGGLTATADSASAKALMFSVVVAPS
jgi:PKD repeat protein